MMQLFRIWLLIFPFFFGLTSADDQTPEQIFSDIQAARQLTGNLSRQKIVAANAMKYLQAQILISQHLPDLKALQKKISEDPAYVLNTLNLNSSSPLAKVNSALSALMQQIRLGKTFDACQLENRDTRSRVEAGARNFDPIKGCSYQYQVVLFQGETKPGATSPNLIGVPENLLTPEFNELLSKNFVSVMELQQKKANGKSFFLPKWNEFQKQNPKYKTENEIAPLVYRAEAIKDAFLISLVTPIQNILTWKTRSGELKGKDVNEELKAVITTQCGSLCSESESINLRKAVAARLSANLIHVSTPAEIRTNLCRNLAREGYAFRWSSVANDIMTRDPLIITAGNTGGAYVQGNQDSARRIRELKEVMNPPIERAVQAGGDNLLLMTTALTNVQSGGFDLNLNCRKESRAKDEALVLNAINEAKKFASDFIQTLKEELKPSDVSEVGIDKNLKVLLKYSPASVGEVLQSSTQNMPWVCGSLKKQQNIEETKEMAVIWGGAIAGLALTATGIGAPEGSTLFYMSIAGGAVGAASTADSWRKTFNADELYQIYLTELLASPNREKVDPELLKVTRSTFEKYEELKYMAMVDTGLSMFELIGIVKEAAKRGIPLIGALRDLKLTKSGKLAVETVAVKQTTHVAKDVEVVEDVSSNELALSKLIGGLGGGKENRLMKNIDRSIDSGTIEEIFTKYKELQKMELDPEQIKFLVDPDSELLKRIYIKIEKNVDKARKRDLLRDFTNIRDEIRHAPILRVEKENFQKKSSFFIKAEKQGTTPEARQQIADGYARYSDVNVDYKYYEELADQKKVLEAKWNCTKSILGKDFKLKSGLNANCSNAVKGLSQMGIDLGKKCPGRISPMNTVEQCLDFVKNKSLIQEFDNKLEYSVGRRLDEETGDVIGFRKEIKSGEVNPTYGVPDTRAEIDAETSKFIVEVTHTENFENKYEQILERYCDRAINSKPLMIFAPRANLHAMSRLNEKLRASPCSIPVIVIRGKEEFLDMVHTFYPK